MKRGKEIRDAAGHQENPNAAKEIMAMMLVLVEKTPGAFALRLVLNEELIHALRSQGSLQQLLDDADELYADFRSRCESSQNPSRPH
jgi:hypothetical protein